MTTTLVMTRQESKVLAALRSLGGEAHSAEISRRMIETSRWGRLLGVLFAGRVYPALICLEIRGILTSDWGEAETLSSNYGEPIKCRSRIYKITQEDAR
jgi:hypothetical protein